MFYNFGDIVADHRVDVQLFFVTSSEDQAGRLSKRFVNSAYHVAVTWVQANRLATEVIKDAMAANLANTPSAIIIDYDSFGPVFWRFFSSLRGAIGDRYVEYVIVDLPADENEHAELQAANVTAMPAADSTSCI
jgi:hypothetical protein